MSDDFDLSPYIVPPDDKNGPKAILARLIDTFHELAALKEGEPYIEILFRTDPKTKAGRDVLGAAYLPSVQGELKPMFEWLMAEKFGAVPDFLIVLDHGYWQQAGEREREILIFHEALHCDQAVDKFGAPRFDRDSGRPVWRIRGHDVEEFVEVARRYGAWNSDLEMFKRALNGGGV